MKTTKRTTYILLERGVEDVALLNEIRAVIVAMKITDTREWVTRFPHLNELQQGLIDETTGDDA